MGGGGSSLQTSGLAFLTSLPQHIFRLYTLGGFVIQCRSGKEYFTEWMDGWVDGWMD